MLEPTVSQSQVSPPLATEPPGPPPVRNHPLDLLRYMRAFQADPIAFVGRRFEEYGDLYASTFRGVPLYVTRHPQHIHEVLVSRGQSFIKPEQGLAARQLRRLLGMGLVTSNGDLWRRQRRMINPAFGRRRIEALGEAMVEKTAQAVSQWRPGSVRDTNDDMMRLTLDIVARTLFDHDVRGQHDTFAKALDVFRSASGAPSLLPGWVPLPGVQRVRRAIANVDKLVYGVIDARRAEPRESLEARTDLLSALVLAEGEQGGMSRQQLRDEILTLFLAGHETTAQALTWTWYLLSKHPSVEALVHRELDEVLGDRLPTAADALPLVDRVIQEAMRMYPPVTTVARVAAEDTRVGEWAVPAGADVILWIYWAHHDPRWWPEPHVFDPDRFLPEREASRPRGAYSPFGGGQRLCIGKHFSLMEARLILATIAQRVRLKLVVGHKVEKRVAVTMSPRHGMKMTVVGR